MAWKDWADGLMVVGSEMSSMQPREEETARRRKKGRSSEPEVGEQNYLALLFRTRVGPRFIDLNLKQDEDGK